MLMTELAKNQHYVPQFLLRGFQAAEGKGQVHTFDKQVPRKFCTSIRNVAAETGFYNYVHNEVGMSAEPYLSRLETASAAVIERVRSSETLSGLSEEDRFLLAAFAATQMVRGKQLRRMTEELNQALYEKIVALGGEPDEFAEYEEFDDESRKRAAVSNLTIARDLVPHFLDKAFLLFKAPEDRPLYLSDHPVVLRSTLPRPGFAGLGVGVEGVEIYLPISKRLILLFLCRRLASRLTSTTWIPRLLNRFAGTLYPLHGVALTVEAIRSGRFVELGEADVDYLNFLQVRWATRFVFSSTNNFKVAEELLAANPAGAMQPPFKIS